MKSEINHSFKGIHPSIIIFKRREEIIKYNNNCILETVIYYNHFFLNNIIRKAYFNNDSLGSKQLTKFLNDRMNFLDRFKLVKEIATNNSIKNISQNKIEKFIEKRNNIAHNLSLIVGYNPNSDQMSINFAGNYIEWQDYLAEIKKWADISLEVAEYTKKVFQSINTISQLTVYYPYYDFKKKCILVPKALLPDDIHIKKSNSNEINLNDNLLHLATDEEKHLNKKTTD